MERDLKKVQTMHNVEAGHNLVFILGIMQRCGTNYLNNLLLLHPDCEYPGFVWEDYLIAPAENLSRYVDSVYQNWHPSWRNKVEEIMGSNSLMNCIGEGLNLFINRQYESSFGTGQRSAKKSSKEPDEYPKLVTATPSVDNLECFFQLFPYASLLIVIRDGRSVVESGMKTFEWDFDHAVRRWVNAAESISRFDDSEQQGRYLIVRYEDIYTNIEDELTKILTFLGLEIKKYNFKAAENLAVIGSSELQDSEGLIHWKAREKRADFNPIGRWSHWKRPRHERFNWLAGAYLERFGYAKKQYESQRTLWNVWNMILDGLYELEAWLRKRTSFFNKPITGLRKLLYSLLDRFYYKSPPRLSDKKRNIN
jgi:hypothetical protein